MNAGAKEKLLLVEKRSNMLKVMVMAMMLMMLINFGPLCPDFLPTLGLFGGNCLLKL